jgi:hypothetical protein
MPDVKSALAGSSSGSQVVLTAHERPRFTDRFDNPNLPGTIHVTVTLKQVSLGTEIHIPQQGLPAVTPAEACYRGWQESLALPPQLVEAEIPA